jgi:serine protease
MKTLHVLSWISFLLLATLLAQSQEPEPARVLPDDRDLANAILRPRTDDFVPGVVIVKPREGVAARSAQDNAASQLGFEAETAPTAGGEIVYRLTPGTRSALGREDLERATLDAVRALGQRPDVEYAQPDYYLHIAEAPNDPLLGDQWNYSNHGYGPGRSPGGANVASAWQTTQGSPSVVVAVLDTGILFDHPDIAGSPNLVAGYDFISNSAMANDGDGRDADPSDSGDAINTNECAPGIPPEPRPSSWHGSHVAGIVGVGRTDNGVGIAGVNWNAKVQPVRVLGKCGGSTLDITAAIRWAAGIAVAGAPPNPTPAKILNMSLGSDRPCDAAFQSAIDDAFAQGVTVVVAAGNDAIDAAGANPAGCQNVITVAASDARGYLATRYSNYGNRVEIMAPGGDVQQDYDEDGKVDGVLSIVKGGYQRYNGTSMAAPHVAGAAALLLAQKPALTPAQVLQELQSYAIPKTSLECPRPCGAGGLNAHFGKYLFLAPAYAPDLAGNDSIQVIVALKSTGGAVSGASVDLSSVNSNVASVGAASGVTNADGRFETTINGESRGETQVSANTADQSNDAFVKVPALSVWAIAGFVGFGLIARGRARGRRE